MLERVVWPVWIPVGATAGPGPLRRLSLDSLPEQGQGHPAARKNCVTSSSESEASPLRNGVENTFLKAGKQVRLFPQHLRTIHPGAQRLACVSPLGSPPL